MGKVSEHTGRELTEALALAAEGRAGALEHFYRMLLESEVWVPVRGREGSDEVGFLVVNFEGRRFVPFFSEQAFVNDWAETEILSVKRTFGSLLRAIDQETHLYINAKQETGKEITTWEIDYLKQGADAVRELIAEQGEDSGMDEVEVRSSGELFPELKRELLPVLELYPELEEAFLIAVKHPDEAEEVPMLGIRYHNISDDKQAYVRGEIDTIARDHLGDAASRLLIVDDLGQAVSMSGDLFSEVTPFYFSRAHALEARAEEPAAEPAAEPGADEAILGEVIAGEKSGEGESPAQASVLDDIARIFRPKGAPKAKGKKKGRKE